MAESITSLGASLLPRMGIRREETKVCFILRRRATPEAAEATSMVDMGTAGAGGAAGGTEGGGAAGTGAGGGTSSEGGGLSQGERIPFHRDWSLVVVNVGLNDGFRGGRLMYALPGGSGNGASTPAVNAGVTAVDDGAGSSGGPRIVIPSGGGGPGCATAHDCSTVHAVSRLVSGLRYSLFAVFERLGQC